MQVRHHIVVDAHVAASPVMASVTYRGQCRPALLRTLAAECPAAWITGQGVPDVGVGATVASEAEAAEAAITAAAARTAAATQTATMGCIGSGSGFDEGAHTTAQEQSLPGVVALDQEPSAQALPLGDALVASVAVDVTLAGCCSVPGACSDDAHTAQDVQQVTRVVQSHPLVIAAEVIKILVDAGLLSGT